MVTKKYKHLPVKVYTDMKKGLNNCNVVMMLRIQKERINKKIMPNQKKYFIKIWIRLQKIKIC